MRTLNPEKHEEKRREILDAAVRCFIRSGFHGSSIASLCAEAGMSAGHLYHYFPSKEAIVEAMVAANLERTARLFAEAASGQAGVLDVIVAQLGHEGVNDDRRAPLLFDMLAEAARNPAIAAALRDHSRGMAALLADLLRRGQAAGEVDASLDPELAATVLISLVDGSKSLGLRNPDRAPGDFAVAFRLLLAKFLGAKV